MAGRVRSRLARTSPKTRAAVMSLILPGLGQAYVDRIGRAVIWLVGVVALNVALRGAAQGWQTAVFVLGLAVCSAVDAALVAPARVTPPPSEQD